MLAGWSWSVSIGTRSDLILLLFYISRMAWYGRIPVYGASISTFFDDDLGEQSASIASTTRQQGRGATSRLDVRLNARCVGRGYDGGATAVCLFADVNIERQLAEQSDTVLLRHSNTTARAKDVLSLTAVRAHMDAHVLANAENGHIHFLEHHAALASVSESDVLWSGRN